MEETMANLVRRRSPSWLRRRRRAADIEPLARLDDWWSPMTLRREIDRLFDELFAPFGELEAPELVPPVEVSESDGEYVITAELPGLSDKDVEVEISDDGVLTLRGEKSSDVSRAERGYQYSERSYGRFERAMPLPPGADASRLDASFQNGVLEIHVPKTAEASRGRRIPIKGGATQPQTQPQMTAGAPRAGEQPQAAHQAQQPQPQQQQPAAAR
jgi:HSP20 family protein